MQFRIKTTLSPFILQNLIFAFISVTLITKSQAQNNESKPGTLRIASCQFPVSSGISENFRWIKKQTAEAKEKNANIVHFPECALSGYPGTDMKSIDNFNWEELHLAMDSVTALARSHRIWLILGSMHRLSGDNKPHNSLYLINAEGEIVDRYDKRFCTTSDLEYFSPGEHFVTFDLNGIRCGLLICYDVRFPELYREYRKIGADLIFQSFYNAREEKGNIHPEIMPLTARAMAASNYFYMSLTNSSAPESWPCYMITPDGLVQGKLDENVPGILISEIDISREFYDASGPFRQDAMDGKLNSGECVTDSMSTNRKGY